MKLYKGIGAGRDVSRAGQANHLRNALCRSTVKMHRGAILQRTRRFQQVQPRIKTLRRTKAPGWRENHAARKFAGLHGGQIDGGALSGGGKGRGFSVSLYAAN